MSRTSLKAVCRLINEATGNLSVDKAFLGDLSRSIEITDEKNRRVPSKTYKPSSMNCIRNMWYQVTGADITSAPSSHTLVGICDSGTDIHIRMQTAVIGMKENNFDCEYIDVESFIKSRNIENIEVVEKCGIETKLYHKLYNMSFLCDGIIRYRGRYYILEIKTETSYKFSDRKGVDAKHYKQATAYSLSFGIDEVMFLYVCRDTFDKKVFILTVTDDMRNNLVDLLNECDNYVLSNTCPPIPDDLDKRTCNYCLYKDFCRSTT